MSLTPGKCQNIHGHSMQVEVHIYGDALDKTGKMDGFEIGLLKDVIRDHLNTEYDHHLLLNRDDHWLRDLELEHEGLPGATIPGLKRRNGDPTTENIARWIYNELKAMLPAMPGMVVTIHETATNSVVYP